jgi:hypothetical protein
MAAPAGFVQSRQHPFQGAPVAGAPGWYVIHRTAPVQSGRSMRWSRRFRLTAVSLTVGLVALLLVLSMVRAHWSEAPAGATVLVPMPPLAMSPRPGPAPGPMLAPKAPIEEPNRPQGTSATTALPTHAAPALPDGFAPLPLESVVALGRSTAEWQSRPRPLAAAPSATRLPPTIDGPASRAGESRTVPVPSSRSSPTAADDPAKLGSAAKLPVASEVSPADDHSALAVPPAATRRQSPIDGSPSRIDEPSTVQAQSGRSSPQVVADSADLRSAAQIQVASQATTADDNPALPAGEIRVFIHHVAEQRDGAVAERLAEYLRGQGFTVADIRTVDFGIGKPSVRYFFARDRAASQRLVEALGRFEGGASLAPDRASDFTHFVPKPRPGSVEVWLPAS